LENCQVFLFNSYPSARLKRADGYVYYFFFLEL
jgi:hypothetical protein